MRHEEIGCANQSMRRWEILGTSSQWWHFEATECHVKFIRHIGSEVRRSKTEFQLCQSLTIWPWQDYIWVGLNFCIYKNKQYHPPKKNKSEDKMTWWLWNQLTNCKALKCQVWLWWSRIELCLRKKVILATVCIISYNEARRRAYKCLKNIKMAQACEWGRTWARVVAAAMEEVQEKL